MHGMNRLGRSLLLVATLAAGVAPAGAQGLGDIGRQLQQGIMGGNQGSQNDRNAYERGRQDAQRDQQRGRERDQDRRRDDARRDDLRREDARRDERQRNDIDRRREEERRAARDQGDRRRVEEPRRYDNGAAPGITAPFTGTRPRY